MLERSIQLLACEFRISSNAEPFMQRVDGLRPSAIQDHPILQRHQFAAHCDDEGCRVSEDDRPPETFGDLDAAAAFVDRRLHELAFAALADRTKLHAGCGTWHGRRFLLVGDRGAGKTTLMTRLLFEDCAVEGDEMVLLRDGQAVAYPRRFGIRRRTLSLVPQVGSLAPHLLSAPGGEQPGGFHVLAFDPLQLDLTWRITTGPVDVLFFLGSRCEGPTRVAPASAQAMARRLMTQSAPPCAGSGAWIRDVGALVRGAAVYDMAVGDLDSAVAAVRQYLVPPATHPPRRNDAGL